MRNKHLSVWLLVLLIVLGGRGMSLSEYEEMEKSTPEIIFEDIEGDHSR